MKIKIAFILLLIFSSVNFYGQNDTTTNDDYTYSIPDSLLNVNQNINMSGITNQDNFMLQSQLQSQKLLKSLFLIGFVFMSFVVIFLLYINNVKIKQILKMVELQERQIQIKSFEIEKMSVILNNTIDAIAIIDAESNLLWNNSSFLTLYGYEKEELKDKKIDFFSSENSDIQELLENVKTNKKPIQFTFDFKNKTDITIYIQRRIIPITNQQKDVENFAIIDTDYTALKIATNKNN